MAGIKTYKMADFVMDMPAGKGLNKRNDCKNLETFLKMNLQLSGK